MPIITLLTKSMQNISDAELMEIGRKLAENEAVELSNQDRAYALGFLMLNLAGEGFFKQVFKENEREKYLVVTGASPGTVPK